MLLYRQLVLTISIFLTTCNSLAIPIQKQQVPLQLTTYDTPDTTVTTILPSIEEVPSIPYTENYNLLNTLDNHYRTVVYEVVESTINEVKQTAPETFLTIHELQLIGKEYCRTSIDTFTDILEKELDIKVKNNLLVSVRPLIQASYNKASTLELNTLLSNQLGLILDPSQISKDIIKQLYKSNSNQQEEENIFIKYIRPIFDKRWAQTIHHEKNEYFALEAWLRSWLMDIEFQLKDEFDSKIPIFF